MSILESMQGSDLRREWKQEDQSEVVAIIEVTNEGDLNEERCLYVEERQIPEI